MITGVIETFAICHLSRYHTGKMASISLFMVVCYNFCNSAINCIFKRSLTRIGLPSVLEPVGLTRDRRRPDGLRLNPWYRGRSLVWDTTVVDTFAEGHYIVSAAIPGSVATDAETDKCRKYNDLLNNY